MMMPKTNPFAACLAAAMLVLSVTGGPADAQVPPTRAERAAYIGLHAAALEGDVARLKHLARHGADLNARDGAGRTPLMVAAHANQVAAARVLVAAGADIDALENQRYDALTIAAVRGDADMVEALIALGANAGQVTSPYEGTGLIAAADRGHVAVVKALIKGGAPLDHVNNLGWTALIEAIVLGDGGPDHTEIVKALIEAGANINLADRNGKTPLALARGHGHDAMIKLLEAAGAKP